MRAIGYPELNENKDDESAAIFFGIGQRSSRRYAYLIDRA
jgi:hypothetical protein